VSLSLGFIGVAIPILEHIFASVEKILFIQTAFIGDAILASASLETWHKNHPNTQIHLLVRKGNEALYKNHPFLEKIWVWNKTEKYRSMFSLIKSFRKERFDLVINFQRFASSGIMTVLSGAKEKRGFSKNPLGFLFSQTFPHQIGAKNDSKFLHEVDRNYQLLKQNCPNQIRKPKLYPSPTDLEKVKKFKTGKYVTLSPSSVWFTKQWPKHKWVELINNLPDHIVYLLGAPSDRNDLNLVISEVRHKNISNLAGELTLLQSASLMISAEMNYVNDSAPMHLASSMNASVTAIYCSTIPEFGFGPLSDKSVVWQSSENLSCRPCGLHGFKACPKGHFKCSNVALKPI